jgi:hypothetical protein
LVARLHLPVKFVYFDFKGFDVCASVFGLCRQCRKTKKLEHFVVLLGVPLALTIVFFGRLSIQYDLIKACPWHLPNCCFLLWISILDVFFLLRYSLDLAVGLHVPEASLLVVISAEVDDVLDKVDNKVVLSGSTSTLVGLIRFWIFTLKLNIYSYLLKNVRYIPTKSLRKLSSRRS